MKTRNALSAAMPMELGPDAALPPPRAAAAGAHRARSLACSRKRSGSRVVMAVAEPEFTLGIEEEYFLVDRATRDVVERSAAGDAGRLRGVAGRAGQSGIFALADRGRNPGLRQPRRGARRSVPAARDGRRGGRAVTAWRRSPRRPILSPAGTRRRPPSAAATPICRMICKGSEGGWRSAGCMSISASPTMSCASTC